MQSYYAPVNIKTSDCRECETAIANNLDRWLTILQARHATVLPLLPKLQRRGDP